MTSDVRELKATLKKQGSPTGRRYNNPELCAQIARVTAGLLASGMSWWSASREIGVSYLALKKICEAKPLRVTNGHAKNGHATNGHAKNGHAKNGNGHLTVHTASGHRVDGLVGPGPLALVTKDGHRVEGLTVATLAKLLAAL